MRRSVLIASFKKKTDLLKTTHLYLQPSFCEAFGYSVLEASALNVLSLVSNKTAQIEIISAHDNPIWPSQTLPFDMNATKFIKI